jgi:hypothetical protein
MNELVRGGIVGLALVMAAAAQGREQGRDRDDRDVVVDTEGKEIRGRVLRAYDPDEVTILQGGKRVRIPRKKIQSVTTVNDHLREFFELRKGARDNRERETILIEWARSRGLEHMAKLQAIHVLADDDANETAHLALGHEKRGREWAWPVGSQWMNRRDYEQHIAKWGHPLVLDGEHFIVRTNAGLRIGVDAAMDLERLVVWWFDTFGKELRPREPIVAMNFHVYAPDDFPPLTGNRFPYYAPQPEGDVSYSYAAVDKGGVAAMFRLATEQLFYNTLADGVGTAQADAGNRFAPWIEIGFGQWVQNSFAGAPGYAEPGPSQLDIAQANHVLRERSFGLENLIGQRYATFHAISDATPLLWAKAATFVAYLMAEDHEHQTRTNLLRYIQLVYAESKGSSSSLLDKTLGVRLEALEPEYVRWLQQQVTGTR